MKSRILVPLALLATSVEPAASDVAEFQVQGIEFLARLTPTEFDAMNVTPQPLLLRFTSSATGASACVCVPGLAEIRYQFPAGSATGVLLEVTSMVGGVTRTTVQVPLNTLGQPEVDAMWVQRHDNHLHSFAQIGDGFAPIDPTTTGGTQNACSWGHVPEVSPILIQSPQLPSKLEAWVPPA